MPTISSSFAASLSSKSAQSGHAAPAHRLFILLAFFIGLALAPGASAQTGQMVYDYKSTVKYYDEIQGKVLSATYTGYFVVAENATVTAVWYGQTKSGATVSKWYSVVNQAPVIFTDLDNKGNLGFTFGSFDVAFGQKKINAKTGAMVSASVSGSSADTVLNEAGICSARFNATLTKKGLGVEGGALQAVILYLDGKKYLPVE